MPTDEQLRGSRVTVMGLGRFGGGAGATRFAAARGAEVLLTDLASAADLDAPLTALADLVASGRVRLRLGGHHAEDFTGADVVIANPAVPRPWANPLLDAARSAGAIVTTEIELLVRRLSDRARVAGITGTAGKSTTSAMLAHVLARAGRRVHLGGNLGGSLLGSLDAIGPEDLVVLELSSAQLWWLAEELAREPPAVAVATSFAPNHLDWHGDLAHYAASKRALFAPEVPGPRSWIVDAEVRRALGLGAAPAGVRVRAPHGVPRDVLPELPGAHNLANAGAALAAAEALLGAPASPDALADFTGLPHRLQRVPGIDGARVVDDSKCTTPEGCALAIDACAALPGAGRVHLVAGGFDKGVSLDAMLEAAARCAGVYAIGATGPTLAAGVRARGGRAIDARTLEAAVAEAAAAMAPGDVLLLSPGCASWDQFANYEARGRAFAELARKYLTSP